MDSRSAFAAKGDAETAQLIHLKNEEEQIRALPPDERTEKEQSIIDRIDAFLSLLGDSLDPDEHPTPFQCPPCGSLTDDYDYETEQHLNWQRVVTFKKKYERNLWCCRISISADCRSFTLNLS